MRTCGKEVLLVGLFLVCWATCACVNAATGREYTGDFVLNREIPVNLVAGTAEHPRLVEVSWVRIEPIYGNAWVPRARVGWSPIADATWNIRVELLDDKGNILKHSRDQATTFTGKADGSNQSALHYAELGLDPMHWEMRRHAAKARVILKPLEAPPLASRPDESAGHRLVLHTVDTASGEPVPDVVVIATSIHRGRQYRSHAFLYRTDSRGECRVAFEKEDLSAARVIAQKAGYANLHKNWSAPHVPYISERPLTELPDRHVIEMVPAQNIGGVVQDQAGRPVADAQVRVEARLDEVGGMAGISRSVQADQEGRWQVEGIPAEFDIVSLGFKHPEYLSDAWANRHIRGDEVPPLRDRKHAATMTKGLTVSGRVLDDQGWPVSRAAVVLAPAYSSGFQYEYAYTVTDAAGQFRFGCSRNDVTDTTPGGGSTAVLVEVPGYVPALQRIVVEPNLAPLELRLRRGRTVTVRVVDGDDRPIAGATTSIHPSREDPRYSLWLGDTDEQGQYQIAHAPEEDVPLAIFKAGYVTLRDHTLPASHSEHVVRLRPAPRIRGAVRDAGTGEPIRDFVVSTRHETGGGTRTGTPMQFKEGRFELAIDEATAESLQLTIQATGYAPATSESIRLEGTHVMEFKLTPDPSFDARAMQRALGAGRPEAVVLKGTVVDPNGWPVSGVAVDVPFFPVRDVVTDTEGKFKLRCPSVMGQPTDRSVPTLIVRDRQRNLAAAVEFDPAAGDDLAIKLTPGVILSGKVTDIQGRGIPDVKMSLTFWSTSLGSGMGDEPVGSDANGLYEIRAVPADCRYSVNATAEGYGQEYIRVNSGETVNSRMELATMVLKVANLDVSGTVVDMDDKPVPGARVYVYGRGQPHRQVQTDDQGRFVAQGLCAGTVDIQANTMGQTNLHGRTQTEGGATDVKIVLSPMGSAGRYVPARPPSLIGKRLPALLDLGIEPSGDSYEEQSILLCFFDVDQRPSRNTLVTLAKRAAELRRAGLVLMAVQAAETDRGALEQWLREQGITLLLGSIKGDAKKMAFAWGVQSLPWLILTDAQHVVWAEGFAVGELDSKISGMKP